MSKAAELANLIGNINAGGGGVNRNVIINGAMNVAQRNVSATGLGASSGYFVCDRWYLYSNANDGRLTMSQDSSVPTGKGFANSLKLDCTTADTSIGTNESLQLTQKIESQNLQSFGKGTSEAKPFAVSFYVKGNASATYVCELMDTDNSNRHIDKTFNVTTDWTRVELTFPADTTGAFDDDNAQGLNLNIFLHSGSFNTSGTLQQTWGTLSQSDRIGSGTTSFFDSTDRTFFITGVQLEVGQNATEFEHVNNFGEELARCQRYFQAYDGGGAGAKFAQGWATSTTVVQYSIGQQVGMRANATVDASNVKIWDAANEYTISSVTGATSYDGEVTFQATGSGLTQYRSCSFRQQASGNGITIDAEL